MEWDPGFPRIVSKKEHHRSSPDELFKFLPAAFGPLPPTGEHHVPVLCALCKGVFTSSFDRVKQLDDSKIHSLSPWHKDIKDLHTSSLKCEFCRLILHGFERKGNLSRMQSLVKAGWDVNVSLSYQKANAPEVKVILCDALWSMYGDGHYFNPESLVWCDDVESTPFVDSPIWMSSETLGFPEALSRIQKWLSWCDDSHLDCSSPTKPRASILPTRILDVGSYLGSREICLVTPGQRRARYIALSHCWGSKVSVTTTVSTMKHRMERIHIRTLPKTFRDAIWITQGLGIQYLWIDSLCIVQDDPSDWEKEAARMTSVYQGAYLTLAATGAEDGDTGCIFPRHPAMRLTIPELDSRSRVGPKRRGLVRYLASEKHSLTKSPLHRRAWVLQESLLSNRIVHFADDQLFWQCRSSASSEDGIYTSVSQTQKSLQSRKKNELSSPQLASVLEKKLISRDDMHNIWWDIVEDYSSRLLTRKSDKWAAIAGVTDFFQKVLPDEPYGGLWRNDIHVGMVWTTKPRPFPLPPPLSGIPSWSWASIDGSVQGAVVRGRGAPYNRVDDAGAVKLLTTIPDQIIWSGRRLTSQIIYSDLVFNGRVQKLTAELPSSEEPLKEWRYHLHQYPRQEQVQAVHVRAAPNTEETTPSNIGICTFDGYPPDLSKPILAFAMILSQSNWHGPAQELSFWWYHVLLLEATGQKPREYRRIGVGVIYQDKIDYQEWLNDQVVII